MLPIFTINNLVNHTVAIWAATTHLQLVNNSYNALEALQYLANEPVDLMFLDINMPKLTGFEFLKTLNNPPKVIVTSAYQEFAIEGA
jgi:YesN/AraC family two-component response regulator